MQTFWGLKNLFIYFGNEFGNFCQTYGDFFFERPGRTALAGKMRQFTGKMELGQIMRKFFFLFLESQKFDPWEKQLQLFPEINLKPIGCCCKPIFKLNIFQEKDSFPE